MSANFHPTEVLAPHVTMRIEAMESGKTFIGGRRMGKTEALRIMMARDVTPPAPSPVEVSRVETGKPVPRDKPWHLYPNGTKAPAHGGGHWIRVTGGWKWCTGDVFPNPGGDNMDMVILPTPPADRPTPEDVDDHKDCKDGCQYALETGVYPNRICPHGECQRAMCANPDKRPTPITDAATSDCVCNSCDERDVVPRKVALDLERQLAEARDQRDAHPTAVITRGESGMLTITECPETFLCSRAALEMMVRDHNALIRERDEARDELAETAKDYQCLASRLDGHDATECRANLDRLIAERDALAKWIVNNPPRTGGDHACAECYPTSEILIKGFRCGYHVALAAVKKPTTEELEIAGFRITADPSLPPGSGIILDPKSGEMLATLKGGEDG